eukprot:COSAG05_NODE_4780_length_1375_cov_1.709248_1_plen_62_part_00
MEGASTADVVSATLSSLGDALVMVSARIAAVGRAIVLFKNEGDKDLNIPQGTLRVVVTETA